MRQAMRGVLGLAGLFNILIGLGFLFNPTKLAAQFALSPIGIQGLATARADFPAFFLTGGLFALAGAWRTDPKPLIVPLVMLGTALTPHLGHALTARVVQRAEADGSSLRDAALALRATTGAHFDRWVDPRLMAGIEPLLPR